MNAWPHVEIADFCAVVSGATPRTSEEAYWDGDIQWATPQDLSVLVRKNISKTARTITSEGLRSCAASILPKGSVLLSSRAPIGHVAINTVPLATNQGFKSLVPDPERADPNYLYYWLKANRPHLESLGNGATFKEISKTSVSRVRLPLPPVRKQRRIAQVLDQVDALRAKRREAIAWLDQLTQYIFLDMFGDPIKNAHGWNSSMVLGNIADICSGITKGRRVIGAAVRSVPYMAVANVQAGHLDLTNVKEIDATEKEISRYRLHKDDLLLTEGGDPDKLGRGTLWDDEIYECIHQNHIFRVRLQAGVEVDPTFLQFLIASRRGLDYFLRSSKQTTGIASINKQQLSKFPLLAPPLKLQQEFARRVASVKQLKLSHHRHLAELDALFGSLQHRAFRGELWEDGAESAA